MNVLLVDDEVIVINILKDKMKWDTLGINKVYTAFTAQEAKNLITSAEIDIIVCDVEMPQENGLQLLAWIQENYPKIERIVLTGFPDFSYAQNAISVGVIKYLLKPVSFEELAEAIKFAMGKIIKQSKKEVTEYDRRSEEKLFYTGLLIEDILPFENYIKKAAEKRNLKLEKLSIHSITYIHLSEMSYDKNSNSIVVYALSNIAEELFPEILEVHIADDIYWIDRSDKSREQIKERCQLFMEKTAGNFHGEISAYFSLEISLEMLAEKSKALKQTSKQYWNTVQNIYDVDMLLNSIDISENAGAGSNLEIIHTVKNYIHANYQKQVTRQDIEKNMHLNGDYVNRIFKKMTGYSLVQYLQYYRVLMAKRLILEQKYTITEVGLQVGFDTPSYFAKIFKKWTNSTPQEYFSQISK